MRSHLPQGPHKLPKGRARRGRDLHTGAGAIPGPGPPASACSERDLTDNLAPAQCQRFRCSQELDRLPDDATGRSARSYYEETTVCTHPRTSVHIDRTWLAFEHQLSR